MPNSEKFSHGGPANFARLFYNFIFPNPEHQWIGLMFKWGKSRSIRLRSRFFFLRREYHCLYVPQDLIKQITRATCYKDPRKILYEPLERLTAFIKEKKPDIVFLNGFGVFNWMLLVAANRAGVPSVIQHAGILTKELHVHHYLYTSAGHKIMSEMEKDSSLLTSAEVFLNSWSRDYYQKNVFRRNDEKAVIIPLPFNFGKFKDSVQNKKPSDSRFILDPKKFHIGVIARWDEIKNHSAVLSLAKEAKKRGLNWQIHSVTEIPDCPKYRLQKREYQNYVSIIPLLDRDGIADFCHSMDLLIQPSLFDVSPTVVLEAMALDTPIIISPNIGYVNNFIEHGAKDWIIDWTTGAKKVVDRILRLRNRQIPVSLKKYLIKAHDQEKVFSSYLKLFSQVKNKKVNKRV